MNIFRLDDNPVQAANDHCDRHCVKMIIESKQLLDTAFGSKGWAANPCAVWARASSENYYWLYRLGVALCATYSARYGRVHALQGAFDGYLGLTPAGVPTGPQTPQPQCMPDEYKGDDAVRAYRLYYIGAKMHFAKWKHSAEPAWLKEMIDGNSSNAERTGT